MNGFLRYRPLAWLFVAVVGSLVAAGCERKKKVIDVKVPGVSIEVNQTSKGVEVDARER